VSSHQMLEGQPLEERMYTENCSLDVTGETCEVLCASGSTGDLQTLVCTPAGTFWGKFPVCAPRPDRAPEYQEVSEARPGT
jgi:hypothetical protein